MSAKLKDKLNEISLMLVMTSDGDNQGIQLLIELCKELSNLARESTENERLVTAIESLQQLSGNPEILTLLQEFTNSASLFLDNNRDIKFPNEKNCKDEDAHSNSETNGDVDSRFLSEFIETHTSMLEDFENLVIEGTYTGLSSEELKKSVKRYIHNLKGDAGSIGLLGIEKVCHYIEDLLENNSAESMIPQLLLFTEWVVQCLNAFAHGSNPALSNNQFISNLEHLKNTDLLQESKKRTETIPIISESKPITIENISNYSLTGEKDILLEFSTEAEEHLTNVESIILDNEGNFDKELVDTIFRGVHSIKGGSAYFNIEEMTKCSHILENMLSEARDGKRVLDQKLRSLLLVYIDLQKQVLKRAKDAIQKNGILEWDEQSISFLRQLDEYSNQGNTPVNNSSLKPIEKIEKIVSQSLPTKTEENQNTSSSNNDKLNLKTFVKVDTVRLDHLIDSIGEMVIYSSMLIRHCRELLHENESVMDTTHRVEKFARDLQDIGMSMRLVPIKGLFQKMSRLVWDTSKKLNKEIQFTMEGEDTELDRNLIDKLADPLMHMVRNSLDHGIETPDAREAKGKPRMGNVKLSASHAGGSIHIRIQDDGKGLNPEIILNKAKEKGVIEEGQKLTESEIFQLIFAPGFSTAAEVTDISGRGVGMDVVRRNVESLRGRINIESKVDKGSIFTIELPLTLAIIDGIQIKVGQEIFIIPSLSIVEFIKPKSTMISNAMDRGETFHFRGKFLPVYRVSDIFNIRSSTKDPSEGTMVVVDGDGEQVAILVDEILGDCSTVIKSIGTLFEEGKGIAGCAIMPRGNVALILDVRSFVTIARLNATRRINCEKVPDYAVIQ